MAHICIGSKVFSRLEPYLRYSTVSSQIGATADSTDRNAEAIESTSSHYIHGDALIQNQTVKKDIYLPEKTTGTISVYTASPSTVVELVSPKGTVIQASKPAVDQTMFTGASLYSFDVTDFAAGTWTVQMKATESDDAYLLVSAFDEEKTFSLKMAGTGKAEQTAFTILTPKHAGAISLSIKYIDKDGVELKQGSGVYKTASGTDFVATLPKVPKPGVYNMTVDIETEHLNGQKSVRTLVRSVYIE